MNLTDISAISYRAPCNAKIEERISNFCSRENLTERTFFLDQELSTFGYPAICTENSLSTVTLVNVTYDLMLMVRQTLRSNSDITDEMRKSESEIIRLKHLLSNTKKEVLDREKELKSKSLLEDLLNQRVDKSNKKFKSEQEKCRKLVNEIGSRDTQYKHEKKKIEQELDKVQTKLQQLLRANKKVKRDELDVLNPLERINKKHGKWNTENAKLSVEINMYQLMIANYEDSQKQLTVENSDMRTYLKQMQKELVSALNEKPRNKSSISSSSTESVSSQMENESSNGLKDGVFEMPYEVVKEQIKKCLNFRWDNLRKEIDHETQHTHSTLDVDQLVEYEKVIREQQNLIDYFTTTKEDKGLKGVPDDTYFLEEKAEFDKLQKTFMQQQTSLEKERKLYTDALLQLGEDRQKFEEEKSSWFQEQFLQLTPFKRETKAKIEVLSTSCDDSMEKTLVPRRTKSLTMTLPSSKKTPNRSDKDEYDCPSTCELYRTLGLQYKETNKENKPSQALKSTNHNSPEQLHRAQNFHYVIGMKNGTCLDDLKTSLFPN